MTAKRFSVVAAAATTVLVAVVALVGTDALGREASLVIDKVFQFTGSAAAVVAFSRTARHRAGVARRWRSWMVAATGSLAVGLAVWIWGQVFFGVWLPTSMLSPVCFVLVPLLVLGAVLAVARGDDHDHAHPADRPVRRPRGRAVLVLDGLVVAGSVFVLTWVSALESVVREWASSGPAFTPVVVHPAGYLVLVVVLLVLSWNHDSVRRLPMLFIALGGLAQSASGWVFAYLISQGATAVPTIADAGFLAGPVLFLLAALAPVRGRRSSAAGETLYLLVPYLPLVVTGLFIAFGTASGVRFDPVEIYAGLAVVLLVIVRQLLTMIDNVRLVEQLSHSREQLRHLAFHDSLTGVANRALLRDRLTAALARQDRVDQRLVLLFIDVDGFKKINDDFGHAEGDAVLRNVAERLLGCVRPEDVVARLGGDEFGVLVDGHRGAAEQIGERVLAALRVPHRIGGREHRVCASIGVCEQTAYEPGCSADDVLGRADAAMYSAKRLGKGMVVVHETPEVARR
ncbi:GGDEF domain-containing protein [Umezawaea beigongshangensis]|uniref:GGDEF domain-containing protein n=1 Tax=Umezawaea beigongshangensis TaxID=2780383 RepID=UPI0018F1AA71|nr:GGDEF domain-containing protein [Umezawaea beigongshangensis]